MALEGLAAHVTKEMVNGLLLARAPEILDQESPEFALFEDTVRGVTTEVVPLAGSDPPEGPRRDLAVRAIAYGVAAEIEASLFPEQQQGEGARAVFLDRRYQALRAQLMAIPGDPPEAGQTPVLGPVGSFPEPARAYPDPAEWPVRCS